MDTKQHASPFTTFNTYTPKKRRVQTFLHTRCKVGMCEDCISFAEEYQMIEDARKEAMFLAEQRHVKIEATFKELERKAEMWEEIARAGLPDVIEAWCSKEIKMLLEAEKVMNNAT